MKADAAAGRVGHVHEAGFYASHDEFRGLILPFVEEGLDAGEPVVIGYDHRKSDLLRGWLRDPSGVTFITDTALYATPAAPSQPTIRRPVGVRRLACGRSVGAVFYGLRRPDPWPTTFGYHEIFHACTAVAAICQYIAIWFAVF